MSGNGSAVGLVVLIFGVAGCMILNHSCSLSKEKQSSEQSHRSDPRERTAGPSPTDAATPPDMPPPGMLTVTGGTFVMGLNDKGILDERPAHEVTIETYFLDETEVTNLAYNLCVDAGVCRNPAFLDTEKSGFVPLKTFRRRDHPVVGVSHGDAAACCKWMGKRLPTEAEWERAARGTDGRLYPWGNEPPTADTAVFRQKGTRPVGSLEKGSGPYGHLDLGGNVWEWVADHYDPYAYTRATAREGIPGTCAEILESLKELKKKKMQGFTGTNPIPSECEHVLRGGAFNYFPFGLRATNRVHHPGRFRIAMAGFRCAKSLQSDPLVKAEENDPTQQLPDKKQ